MRVSYWSALDGGITAARSTFVAEAKSQPGSTKNLVAVRDTLRRNFVRSRFSVIGGGSDTRSHSAKLRFTQLPAQLTLETKGVPAIGGHL